MNYVTVQNTMHLIVSEKYNAAERIATILSDSSLSRGSVNDVPVFTWDGGDVKCMGLAGHIVELDFPDEYNDWREVDPSELVDAPVVTRPSKNDLVTALESLANNATRVTIATDYDREGELIGKEAIDIIEDVNPSIQIDRARFSSLTNDDVSSAFNSLEAIDYDLAAAGEARQVIDLRWGASLTRFFTLASTNRDGVLSVGRVQTPTLKLLVDREREILEFDPDPYWEITAPVRNADGDLDITAQYYYVDDSNTEAVRVWDEQAARAIHSSLDGAVRGEVIEMDEHERNDYPPTPFDTTEFIKAAGAIGFDAKPAMSIAEELYDNGYITYPRTDNTVYPEQLDGEQLLTELADSFPSLEQDIQTVLSQSSLSPTSGDTESTDHPPIHPTENTPAKSELSDSEWTIYELVTRRFAATFAEAAVWNHRRIDVLADDEYLLKANGKTLVSAGYHDVYPYFDTDEDALPLVAEGAVVQIGSATLHEKETQPPNRYGQSRLIDTMESKNLGTKSTRHNTIDKLYDREYIRETPPVPTDRAFALINAAEEYASQMTTPETTAQLEDHMDAIASGDQDLTDVTSRSQDVLREVFENIEGSREELTRALNMPLSVDDEQPTEEDALGRCPECNELLLPKQANGSKFIGCQGYPDCEFTLPLPNTGRVHFLDETCDTHGYKHVKMIAGSETEVYGCPQCQKEEAEDTEDVELGACPECGDEDNGVLAIKEVRTGSRLIGCTRYPDCEYSLPVPQSGDLHVTDDMCDEHNLPELEVHSDDDDPWELGCPICNYESMNS